MIAACDACETDFADAASPDLVQVVVGIIEEDNVDIRAIGVDRYDVVGEIAIQRRATTLSRTRWPQAWPYRRPSPRHPQSDCGLHGG